MDSLISEVRLDVRWTVIRTEASGLFDDYEPIASQGEPARLVNEVTQLCKSFHPASEIRNFPQTGEVILFWEAHATTDFLITVIRRVRSDSPRAALEYVTLILARSEFNKLGMNPFRAVEEGFAEQIRGRIAEQRQDSLTCSLRDLKRTPIPLPPNERSEAWIQPGEELPSTPENIERLRIYCHNLSVAEKTPPTFATWWAHSAEVPAEMFTIVLRGATSAPLTIQEMIARSEQALRDVLSYLPESSEFSVNARETARNLGDKAQALYAQLREAGERAGSDTPEQFRDRMIAASTAAAALSLDLDVYMRRYGRDGKIEQTNRIDAVIKSYDSMANALPRLRHPNPFGGMLGSKTGLLNGMPYIESNTAVVANAPNSPERPAPMAQWKSAEKEETGLVSEPPPAAKSRKRFTFFAVISSVVLSVMLSWILLKPRIDKWWNSLHPGSSPDTNQTRGTGKPAPPPSEDIIAVFQKHDLDAAPLAKTWAGQRAWRETVTTNRLSEEKLQEITGAAFLAAFRATLTPQERNKALKDSRGWGKDIMKGLGGATFEQAYQSALDSSRAKAKENYRRAFPVVPFKSPPGSGGKVGAGDKPSGGQGKPFTNKPVKSKTKQPLPGNHNPIETHGVGVGNDK